MAASGVLPMTFARIFALVLLMGLLEACASAGMGAPGAGELQRRFSAGEIVEILQDEGYGSVAPLAGDGVRFKADGMSYVLTIYEDGDLQLYFGLTGIAVSPGVVNEWNRTRRLTRAYLDSELDPVLETDLLSDAGISRPMLVRWVQIFVQGSGLYHAYLLDHGTVDSLPANASPASI
jgi:hypothetical protein